MEVRAALVAAADADQGLATRRNLASRGVSGTRLARALAAGEVVRVRRRVYSLAPLDPLPRFVVTGEGVAPAYARQVRAVLLSMTGQAAACGRTAAALYGWGMLVEPARTVEVAVPHGRGTTPRVDDVRVVQRRRLMTVHREVLPGTAPVRVTTPTQTALDCAAELPLLQAVVVVDSALRAGHVTLEVLRQAAERRGSARIRRVLAFCDPRSGSVLESVLRVRMQLAGVEGWASQVVLRLAPELRVDFCFPLRALVLEVDGARWHQDPARDRNRDNALAVLGWRVLRFTWADVVYEPERVVRQIAAALACQAATVPGGASRVAA